MNPFKSLREFAKLTPYLGLMVTLTLNWSFSTFNRSNSQNELTACKCKMTSHVILVQGATNHLLCNYKLHCQWTKLHQTVNMLRPCNTEFPALQGPPYLKIFSASVQKWTLAYIIYTKWYWTSELSPLLYMIQMNRKVSAGKREPVFTCKETWIWVSSNI